MIRRKHKKSRLGCVECKRRHIKCDENKPVCGNCVISERQCSFPSPRPRQSRPTACSPPVSDHSPKHARPNLLSWSISSPADSDAGFDNDVNIRHMELLVHFSISIPIPEIDETLLSSYTRLVLDAGLGQPYLLYQTLAISARHLAVVNPSLSPVYLREATGLQRSSIKKFNSLESHIDGSNCVSALLFSSILARHMLADTLASVNHSEEFSLFLNQYVKYIHVQRGVRAVASLAWPFLVQSDLRPLLFWGSGLSKTSPRGGELRELSASMSEQSSMDKDAMEACMASISSLQVGLDYLLVPESRKWGLHMVFNWAVLLPTKFIELLIQHEPETLVILGHYAVLLHLSKDIWQVGDSGRHILRGVVKQLASKWVQMLWWPLSIIGLELGPLASSETLHRIDTVG